MALEEFEIDGVKILINNEVRKDETGVVSLNKNEEDDLEKTKEIEIPTKEDLLDKTLTNVFGEEKHE